MGWTPQYGSERFTEVSVVTPIVFDGEEYDVTLFGKCFRSGHVEDLRASFMGAPLVLDDKQQTYAELALLDEAERGEAP